MDEEDLAFLVTKDTNRFDWWEAEQKLFTSIVFQTMDTSSSGNSGFSLEDKWYTLALPSGGGSL